MRKPTVRQVLGKFIAYKRSNPVWGVFREVFLDGAASDSTVAACLEAAIETGEVKTIALAKILRRLDAGQRKALPTAVENAIRLTPRKRF